MSKFFNILELLIKNILLLTFTFALTVLLMPDPTAVAAPSTPKKGAKKPDSSASKSESKIAESRNTHGSVSPAVTVLPFGVGYFAKGHSVLGSMSFALQAAALGGYFYFNELADAKEREAQSFSGSLQESRDSFSDEDLNIYSEQANSYIEDQRRQAFTSLAVFAGTWGLSALHSSFGINKSVHIGATLPKDFDLPALTLTMNQ